MKIKIRDEEFNTVQKAIIKKRTLKIENLPISTKKIDEIVEVKKGFRYTYEIKTKDNFSYITTLNFIQHSRLKFIMGENWFQKEDNIRYLVNILFLVIGTYLTYKTI